LYQSDWLLRFYGFAADELFERDGMLDLGVDPKLAWALRHRDRFPIDVNRAAKADLLRVPGLGVRTVQRIITARGLRKVRLADLQRLRVPLQRVLPFVVLPDHTPGRLLDSERLEGRLRPAPAQMSLLTHDA
jgi:predicted DNA-binding helix-hairpin-helix protein